MNRIEFSDINKFLTSLGLILIGVAILLPLFIGQNTSVFIVEQDKIDQSSEMAKAIISNQQSYLFFISKNLTLIMISLIAIGLSLLIIGICRWTKRQKVIDQIQDEDLISKKQQNISKEEKQEIIESELDNLNGNKAIAVQKYIDVENMIFLKLSNYYKVNYTTLQNMRIGQFNYDVIIKSKYIEKRGDILVEIKYYEKTLDYNRLLEAMNRFLLAINHYENTQRRRMTPVIIFVHNENTEIQEINQIKEKLESYKINFQPNMRIRFFMGSDIQSIEPPKLISNE